MIAAGDFNVSRLEERKFSIYRALLGSTWQVATGMGCDECKGTEYYRNMWSFLDNILLKSNSSHWHFVEKDIYVAAKAPSQIDDYGRPRRFDAEKLEGVSDHLPIVATFAN